MHACVCVCVCMGACVHGRMCVRVCMGACVCKVTIRYRRWYGGVAERYAKLPVAMALTPGVALAPFRAKLYCRYWYTITPWVACM